MQIEAMPELANDQLNAVMRVIGDPTIIITGLFIRHMYDSAAMIEMLCPRTHILSIKTYPKLV